MHGPQSPLFVLRQTGRIMFMRGSPERLLYSRRTMIVALLLAVLLSGAARMVYFGDHLTFAILWAFAKTTMFMLWMVLLTAKVARLRLASMMLSLVLISLCIDGVYLLTGPLPLGEARTLLGRVWGLSALYGMASVVGWALRKPLGTGAMQATGYLAAVVGLDMAFRHLYATMAAA